jgi:deoxyribodipyrimidine photolyase-like uncharacterized protein
MDEAIADALKQSDLGFNSEIDSNTTLLAAIRDFREKLSDAGYVIVNKHIEDGKNRYLQVLLKADAVDDFKMKLFSYFPLAECLKKWNLA